jgi:hypothetical protein
VKSRPSVPALCATLALLYSCAELEPKGWLVDRTRVLGAHTEAVAEPARSTLLPGERGAVTWLVVTPEAPPRLSWSFAACLPPAGNYVGPRCDGPVLVSGAGTSDGELVRMDLEAPALAATGDAPDLLVLAAFCANGAVALDPRTFTATCSGGGAALLATTRVRLAAAGINRNPAIADDAIRLGDIPLPPAKFSISVGPCSGAPDAPAVQAGVDVNVRVRVDDGAREGIGGGREGLMLSHMVTSGELDRQYSSLAPEDPAPKDISVELTAPGSDASGRLVRLFFVLRDDRGAMSFAVRSVCVRP